MHIALAPPQASPPLQLRSRSRQDPDEEEEEEEVLLTAYNK